MIDLWIILSPSFQCSSTTMDAMTNYPKSNQYQLKSTPHNNKGMRILFIGLGGVFVLIGLIGVVLPVLPTTPFILLAAACWAKGSQKFHQWLVTHKTFGKMVINWQQHRSIPRKAKHLAWTMMSLSCAMLFYRFSDNLQWLAWLTTAVCVATALWMSRLPDA